MDRVDSFGDSDKLAGLKCGAYNRLLTPTTETTGSGAAATAGKRRLTCCRLHGRLVGDGSCSQIRVGVSHALLLCVLVRLWAGGFEPIVVKKARGS